jgi:multidrug efflux pump subunit AcrB
LSNIPLRAPNLTKPTTLDTVVKLNRVQTATELDHYQIRKVSDVYVTPVGEDLGRVRSEINQMILDSGWAAAPASTTSQGVAYTPGSHSNLGRNVRVDLRGMVNSMQQSFSSFAKGFMISFILLFLILVAQFRSFIDPFLIMLAIPMGFIGVLVILPLTHSSLNVMSLMGVLMLIGIADSNSILIVDFAHRLEEQGLSVTDAAITACRVRLRPILMTSLATIIGMIPMAMKLGTGAEQYAPMARAIIGGLTSSVMFTIFIVPAAYVLVYRNRRRAVPAQQ